LARVTSGWASRAARLAEAPERCSSTRRTSASPAKFEIAPVYQARFENNTHGVGLLAMDSLNNERIALGLGYIATLGGPKVSFSDAMDKPQTLQLTHIGHEVSLPISINAVLGWLALGVRPKFQFTAMRFKDPDGTKQDARVEQTAFGPRHRRHPQLPPAGPRSPSSATTSLARRR
jgi:hypothetical protein